MTPSGVHINKTAIAVIIGLFVVISVGFKLRGGSETVIEFNEKDSGNKPQTGGLQNKDATLKKKQEEEEEYRRKVEELKKKEEELKKQKEEEVRKEEELKKKEEELKKQKEDEAKKEEELKKQKEEEAKKEEELKKQKEEEAKKEEELKKKEEELKKQKEGGSQTEQDKNIGQNQTKKADEKKDTVQKPENQTEKREEKKETDLKSSNQTLKETEQKSVNQTTKQEVKKEPEQKLANHTVKQEDKKKSENMTSSTAPDWKTVKLEDIKVPDSIMTSAANMKVEEKEYKVLDLTIFARTVKPQGDCKGGVLLLHGQKFKSEDWDQIKTLHFIGAMGYTPMAIDLPGYGKSSKTDVADRVKFMEELLKVTNFTAPVIVSPSMSGGFALPFIMSDPKTADKRSRGYIPVAPVTIKQYEDKYPELNIPAALVYGENDSNFRDTVEKTLSKIPNSRLFMINKAGHACYLDKPDEWHKILYVFLPVAFK